MLGEETEDLQGDSFHRTADSILKRHYKNKTSWKSNEDSRVYDKASEHVDLMLAKEFTKLSLQERERTYEELHGVNDVIEETPELLQRSFRQFNEELMQIRYKPAFEKAMEQNPAYTNDSAFRLMFLRAQSFHPKNAASQMVNFFEGKLKFFGLDLLTRRIQLNDLTKHEQDILKYGQMQILSSRDRSGRLVWIDMNMICDRFYDHIHNRMRVILYMAYTLAEDEENQKRGIVTLIYQEELVDPRTINIDLVKAMPQCLKAFPIRAVASHFCAGHSTLQTLARIAILSSPADVRARHRLHVGTHTEMMYSLLSFGIPVDTFPLTANGTIKKINLNRWIARQKIKDKVLASTGSFSGIDAPGAKHILLGKGRPVQEHSGNLHLRHVVEEYMEDYVQAGYGIKQVVSTFVVDAVKAKGYEFLVKSEDGWWYVTRDDELAKEKVMKVFSICKARALKEQQQEHQHQQHQQNYTGEIQPTPENQASIFQPERRKKQKLGRSCFGC